MHVGPSNAACSATAPEHMKQQPLLWQHAHPLGPACGVGWPVGPPRAATAEGMPIITMVPAQVHRVWRTSPRIGAKPQSTHGSCSTRRPHCTGTLRLRVQSDDTIC